MTNLKDWNYIEMGFNSEEEMKASYDRVTEKMNNPKNDIELEVERRNELVADLKANNNQLDTAKLREDARQSDLDIKVHNRILYDKEQAKLQAKQEEMQSFLKEAGESIAAENEAKAQKEMQEAKEKSEVELQKEIHSKHGVKTDKEKQLDDAYSKMLGN